jgi:hypothetical protein
VLVLVLVLVLVPLVVPLSNAANEQAIKLFEAKRYIHISQIALHKI